MSLEPSQAPVQQPIVDDEEELLRKALEESLKTEAQEKLMRRHWEQQQLHIHVDEDSFLTPGEEELMNDEPLNAYTLQTLQPPPTSSGEASRPPKELEAPSSSSAASGKSDSLPQTAPIIPSSSSPALAPVSSSAPLAPSTPSPRAQSTRTQGEQVTHQASLSDPEAAEENSVMQRILLLS